MLGTARSTNGMEQLASNPERTLDFSPVYAAKDMLLTLIANIRAALNYVRASPHISRQ